MTPTRKNPYPERGCGFLVGVGVGRPEIPQGYPCQSLPMADTVTGYHNSAVISRDDGRSQVSVIVTNLL